MPDALQDADDPRDLVLAEEHVRPCGGAVRVGRLEQAPGVDHTIVGELVDDQVDEADLVDAEPVGVQVRRECLGGCAALKPDDGADEQPESAGLLADRGEVGLTDAAQKIVAAVGGK